MKKKFIFVLIFMIAVGCSSYEGSRQSNDYDLVSITFRGYSSKYSTNEKIKIWITDPIRVSSLNEIKNSSEAVFFGGSKGNDYTIDLIYSDIETGDKLLVRILKNIESKPTVIYGAGTFFDGLYRNQELVDYVTSIIRLDAIMEYEGSLTQKEYDAFILRDND